MIVRPRRGLIQAAVIAAAVAGFAATAHAQIQNAPVDLEIFRPAMDSKGFFTINSSGVLGAGRPVVRSRHRLRAQSAGRSNGGMVGGQPTKFAVDNLITPSLQAAVGFTHLPHLGFELGLVLPMAHRLGASTPERSDRDGDQGLDLHRAGARRPAGAPEDPAA